MDITIKDNIRILILFILWIAAFFPIYPELIRDWLGHSDNSHAFIVPLIAAFFAWQRRKDLRSARIGGSAWGASILAISLIIYLLSYAGGIAFPARAAMVFSLFGLVWFCLGSEIIRILAFPILFLLFMVPVPYSFLSLVSMPLQLMATRVSATLIEYCSIPVYREGNMLYFVRTQLEVAEACSGIRSIMSLTMLSLVFCYFSREGWWRKALLVAAAIPIAMMANILRVTGTGILAHFYGDKVARGFLHEFSGLVVFAFGFMVLFAVFSLLNRIRPDDVD
jgi:exosortase